MQLDDLSALPDDDLCALEGHRSLEPSDWRRIDDELRRRRRSRVPGLADLPDGPPAGTMPTLGDLERVTAALALQLAETQHTVRRLRWWIVIAPLIWSALVAAAVLVTRATAI
jgi:hypothetical protein